MRKMIDVYSGLGGASEAFVRHPGWEVLRIENNPLLSSIPETVIIDAKEFKKIIANENIERDIDLLWFSPPCRDFSDAYSSPKSKAARNNEEYHPSLELLDLALEIIDILKPRFYIIENVRGAAQFFEGTVGKPRQIIGPFYLWGNFPLIHMPPGFNHSKYEHDKWSTDPLRANHRALIPIQLSQGLLEAVMSQRTLEYWN